MKVISISGVIGWDVTAKDIRSELDKAKGEDIEVQVSSPGGLVIDGLEIYNLIKNYEGNKSSRLMGLAASMASYIVLAGDKVIAEDNAIYMIHNAMGIAWGDKNTMQKMSEILAGFSRIFAKAYARKSGKSIKEIEDLMDDETFYFGQEILDEGFVDEIVPAPEDAEKDKAAMLSMAMAQIEQCKKVISELETSETLVRAAAIFGNLETEAVGPDEAVEAATKTKKQEVKNMNLDELKKEHPALYAEIFGAGREEGEAKGIKQERERVLALIGWKEADAANEKVASIVAEAIASGKTEEEVKPQLSVAVRDFAKGPGDAGENPPDVSTSSTSTGAGAGDFTAEDIAAAQKAGLSVEDLKKYGPKKKAGGE